MRPFGKPNRRALIKSQKSIEGGPRVIKKNSGWLPASCWVGFDFDLETILPAEQLFDVSDTIPDAFRRGEPVVLTAERSKQSVLKWPQAPYALENDPEFSPSGLSGTIPYFLGGTDFLRSLHPFFCTRDLGLRNLESHCELTKLA